MFFFNYMLLQIIKEYILIVKPLATDKDITIIHLELPVILSSHEGNHNNSDKTSFYALN